MISVPPLKRVADRPTWLLSRAYARSHNVLNEAFAAEGVRGYHFRLLAALDQYGPTSQADLGRHTGIDRSDVVATVNDLVTRGLVQRKPDPVDRRRNVITITKRGVATLERLDAVLDDVQDTVLAALTANERKTFVRLLAKVIDEHGAPGA
jgi:MarR family transcriptional regulator, lower aerobic nicotinate degradation pathway regulator